MKLCGFADELWVEPNAYTDGVTRRIESHVRACVPGWLWPIDYALTTYGTSTGLLDRIEISG